MSESRPPTRPPTDSEIAHALDYVQREFKIDGDTITSTMLAEALAVLSHAPDCDLVCCLDAVDLARAHEHRAQLSDAQWRQLTTAADYLRMTEFYCAEPRYQETL